MNNLQNPINFGYRFTPSEYLSKGYQLFKKVMGPLIGMTLLFFIIQMVLASIPFLNFISGIVNTILFAGFFIYLANFMLKKESSGDFFKGFEYTLNILLFRLVYVAFIIPMIIIVFLIGFPVEELIGMITGTVTPDEFVEVMRENFVSRIPILLLSFLFFMGLVIYLSISYIFVIPLIVINKLGFWEAMELSRKVVAKNFFGYFFALLLFGLMLIIPTIITCGLALLFFVPLLYCAIHVAFVEIFKPLELEAKSDLDEFGQADQNFNSENDFR